MNINIDDHKSIVFKETRCHCINEIMIQSMKYRYSFHSLHVSKNFCDIPKTRSSILQKLKPCKNPPHTLVFASIFTTYVCWERRTRRPWGPTNISFKKLSKPNQTTGVTSTPTRGGITFRVGMSSGSVDAYARTYGNLPTGSFGYHDMTILRMKRKPNAERKGPINGITSFAVAGSRSNMNRLCFNSLVIDVSRTPTLLFAVTANISKDCWKRLTPWFRASIPGWLVMPKTHRGLLCFSRGLWVKYLLVGIQHLSCNK